MIIYDSKIPKYTNQLKTVYHGPLKSISPTFSRRPRPKPTAPSNTARPYTRLHPRVPPRRDTTSLTLSRVLRSSPTHDSLPTANSEVTNSLFYSKIFKLYNKKNWRKTCRDFNVLNCAIVHEVGIKSKTPIYVASYARDPWPLMRK